jgi:LysR family hydrogen peroxide-inducible transcriptional activator
MITPTILEQLKKAQIDMGIMAAPLGNPEFLEIPLYHEKFYAYVSPKEDFTGDVIDRKVLADKRIWIMRDGVQQYDRSMLQPGETFTYDRMYEGGRVGTLIQIANQIGGYTIIPELHLPLIKDELKGYLRPIVNPEASRTIILVIRRDYVHERMMNVIIESLKTIIPPGFLESMIKTDYLRL